MRFGAKHHEVVSSPEADRARRALLVGLVCSALASSGTSCGGGSEASHADVAKRDTAAAASPEEQCLSIATAKHERRAKEPDSITVSHILVKHRDAKSPKAGVSRSRGEACLRALEAQKKLGTGADFTALVGEYSDSPGVSNDGALGSVHRSDLEPAFADAAFQLERGQMSDVVETPFGFHVIVRTE